MKILRGARGALLPLVLCCGLLLVAGCGAQTATKGAQDGSDASVVTESGAKAGQPVSGEKKETAAKELTVKVYYPNDDGTKLVAVSRKIKTDKEDKYTAVMRSLLAGTQEKGHHPEAGEAPVGQGRGRHGEGELQQGAREEFRRRLYGGRDARRLHR